MGNGPHMNSGQCLSQFFPACSNQGGIVVCQRVFPRHFAAWFHTSEVRPVAHDEESSAGGWELKMSPVKLPGLKLGT